MRRLRQPRFCSTSCEPSTIKTGRSRMASVRKSITGKGTTRWQAVWQEPAPGGRRRDEQKTSTAKRKRASTPAQERRSRTPRRRRPEKHSLERYLKRWLATLTERGEHSPSTLDRISRAMSGPASSSAIFRWSDCRRPISTHLYGVCWPRRGGQEGQTGWISRFATAVGAHAFSTSTA